MINSSMDYDSNYFFSLPWYKQLLIIAVGVLLIIPFWACRITYILFIACKNLLNR